MKTKFPPNEKHFALKESMQWAYQSRQLAMAIYCARNFELAIDCGAHVGLMSRKLSPFFRRVVAFEPTDENFACLRMNAPSNVVCMNRALWSSHRVLYMHNPTGSENSGAWEQCEADTPNSVSFFTDTLDSYNFEPGLIKLDVQGAEYEILKGAESMIERARPTLLCECEKNGKTDVRLLNLLSDLEYDEVARIRHDRIFVARN